VERGAQMESDGRTGEQGFGDGSSRGFLPCWLAVCVGLLLNREKTIVAACFFMLLAMGWKTLDG